MYQNQYFGPMNDFMQSDAWGPFGMFDGFRQQLAQNPFLQGLQPERDMGNYMQDVQSSRAMQSMDPRLQQDAMARHQAAPQQHMAQQEMRNNPFDSITQTGGGRSPRQQITPNVSHPSQSTWNSSASAHNEQEFLGQRNAGGVHPDLAGRDMMAEREQYLSNIPEAQRAQAGRQFDDHYARVGWTPPQQPGPNFGPQPGPGEMIQQRQAPFMGDRVGPGQNFAQRFGGQQFGPGLNFPMPQFGGQQFGPQQPNPQFGPQRPGQQQGWTPPSVNMPMSQQGQPWMGNEMQQRQQSAPQRQQSAPQRQQSAPQQNPFMRMNPFQGMSPGNPRNADRGTPVNQPPPPQTQPVNQPPPPQTQPVNQRPYTQTQTQPVNQRPYTQTDPGYGNSPMPGSRFNSFAQLTQY